MKLLVRATNWLGDAVISLPALREIRRVHEGWEIVVLARSWVADLYRRESFCDRMMCWDERGAHAGLAGRWRLGGELRAEGFDRAILLPNSFDSALAAWLGRVPERIGYAGEGRGALLTAAIERPAAGEVPKHQRYYYLELLRRAGLITKLPDCEEIRLAESGLAAADGREYWRRRDMGGRRWVGVSPGAANSRAKQWLPERFGEAARQVADELEASVAVFGSAGERELCGTVAEQIGPRARNLAGETTLAEFVDLVACCDVFLTHDSGAMHVAAALGVPTVAVFGPTDETATGPSAPNAHVLRHEVDCSPCLLKDCPIDHRCMTRVEAGDVVAKARAIAGGSSAG